MQFLQRDLVGHPIGRPGRQRSGRRHRWSWLNAPWQPQPATGGRLAPRPPFRGAWQEKPWQGWHGRAATARGRQCPVPTPVPGPVNGPCDLPPSPAPVSGPVSGPCQRPRSRPLSPAPVPVAGTGQAGTEKAAPVTAGPAKAWPAGRPRDERGQAPPDSTPPHHGPARDPWASQRPGQVARQRAHVQPGGGRQWMAAGIVGGQVPVVPAKPIAGLTSEGAPSLAPNAGGRCRQRRRCPGWRSSPGPIPRSAKSAAAALRAPAPAPPSPDSTSRPIRPAAVPPGQHHQFGRRDRLVDQRGQAGDQIKQFRRILSRAIGGEDHRDIRLRIRPAGQTVRPDAPARALTQSAAGAGKPAP